MNNYPDILILAIAAGFIIYKLYSSLGKLDESMFKHEENIINTKIAPNDEDITSPSVEVNLETLNSKSLEGFKLIQAKEPDFNIKKFLKKATLAFEYILGLYNKQETENLKDLLAPEVFATFEKDIQNYSHKKVKLNLFIVSISDQKILDISVVDNVAYIKVEFLSHQIIYETDLNGNIINGNDSEINKKHDCWTFSRELGSSDPKWLLTSTEG
jgi:predicted lipid-binding transport protein (Tim44 family)